MSSNPTLSRDRARRFYDRLGAGQDSQTWYEAPALARLVEQADLAAASAVVEIGCGTGRFAAELLDAPLTAGDPPSGATYRGFDLSPTMVDLARRRLASFGERARAETTSGEPPLPLADGCCDRVLSTYVFDLLPEDEIAAWAAEARRLLRPGGRLCLAGIAPGTGLGSKLVMGLWSGVHRLAPVVVGGCRPLHVAPLLGDGWQVLHRSTVVAWGIASEVLVAQPAG